MGVPLAALAIQPQPNIADQAGKFVALKSALQNQQYQAQAQPLELQQRQQAIQEQNDIIQSRQALRQAYAAAVKPDEKGQPQIDSGILSQALAASNHGDQIPQVLDSVNKFQKTKNDLIEQTQKIQSGAADINGYAAKAVKDAGYEPALAHTILDTLPNNPQTQQLRQLIDGDPAVFKQHIDSAIAASPALQKLENERQIANIRASGGAENRELNAALQSGKIKDESEWPAYKAKLAEQNRVAGDIAVATNPDIQRGKVQVAAAEGAARAQATAGNPASDPAVDMVGQGRMDYATATARYSPLARQVFDKELAAKYPQYNQMNYGVEKGVLKNFTSGDAAKNLTAFNTAIEHANQLQQAADLLNNGKVVEANKIGNAIGYQFGSDKTTNFNVIKSALSGEISKVFKGGQATDAEIKEVQAPFDAANSPAQLKGAINNAVRLMNSKRDALKAQYDAGMKAQPNFGNSGISVQAPNGKTYTFPDQASADRFKQAANIK